VAFNIDEVEEVDDSNFIKKWAKEGEKYLSEVVSSLEENKAFQFTKNVFNNEVDKIQDSINLYRPVYRIAITYPINDGKDIFTAIVADTSGVNASYLNNKSLPYPIIPTFSAKFIQEIKNKFGVGVNDVLGMWVDADDIASPDKSVVLLRVDPQVTIETVLGNKDIDDKYFAFNGLFSVRNYIDIWMGYKKDDGTIYPESFDWYNSTHVFTGIIVAITRKYSSAGDSIAVVSYSPEIILMNSHYKNLKQGATTYKLLSYYIESNKAKQKFYADALVELFSKLIPMSVWQKRNEDFLKATNPTEIPEKYLDGFPIGDFYWRLLKNTIVNTMRILRGKKSDNTDSMAGSLPMPLFDTLIDKDIFHKQDNPRRKMKASIVANGNPSFWDILTMILLPEHSNNEGIGFKFIKHRSWNMVKNSPSITFFEGKSSSTSHVFSHRLDPNFGITPYSTHIGHPGLWFQFYFAIERDEYQQLYENQNNPLYIGKNIKKYVDFDYDVVKATLGKNIIDMETYIDYGTVYNSFRLMTKTNLQHSSKDELIHDKAQVIDFPTSADQITRLVRGNDQIKKLWSNILLDQQLYGQQILPVVKWFAFDKASSKSDEEAQVHLGASKPVAQLLSVSEVPVSEVVSHYGITRMFRRYYFGGLEGSAMVIGNPQMQVGRFIAFRDIRNAVSTALGGLASSNNVLNKLNSMYGQNPAQYGNDRTLVDKYTQFNALQNILNFQLGVTNKFYYIWKTRHYYGAQKGFETKVYFTQTRSRAWRLQTRDIKDVLRQAQRIREEL